MLSVKDPLYTLPRCEYAKCTERVYKGKVNATQIEESASTLFIPYPDIG